MESSGGGTAAVVNTAINTGGGGAGGVQNASFSVDIAKVPELINKYKDAQERLDLILEKASELQYVAPPGNDQVSKRLSDELAKMAGANPGKLSWAVTEGRNRLQNQIDQLQKALADYKATDEAAKASQRV